MSTDDQEEFTDDLLRRLGSEEDLKQIVGDIPYGVLDNVSGECASWDDILRMLRILSSIIRTLLANQQGEFSMNQDRIDGGPGRPIRPLSGWRGVF